MKWLSPRISFEKHTNTKKTTIIISPKIEKWKESILFGWICLWLLIGIAILYSLIFHPFSGYTNFNSEKETDLYLYIFLIIWGYFAFKSTKAYLWRIKGYERIQITPETLTIKTVIAGFGKEKPYETKGISELSPTPIKEDSFASVMNSSFWDLGIETITFKYNGSNIYFGRQLNSEETTKLIQYIHNNIKSN